MSKTPVEVTAKEENKQSANKVDTESQYTTVKGKDGKAYPARSTPRPPAAAPSAPTPNDTADDDFASPSRVEPQDEAKGLNPAASAPPAADTNAPPWAEFNAGVERCRRTLRAAATELRGVLLGSTQAESRLDHPHARAMTFTATLGQLHLIDHYLAENQPLKTNPTPKLGERDFFTAADVKRQEAFAKSRRK